MLDMITFWVVYGFLMVCWFSFPLYWSFNLVDWWLENITDGDMKCYLQDNFRNPFLNKLGLMEKTDNLGYLKSTGEWNYMFNEAHPFLCKNNRWSAVVVWWLSFVGFIVMLFMLGVSQFATNQLKGENLHTFTVLLSEFATEQLSLPIFIIFVLVLCNTLLKKLYKFGKKAKTAIDKLDNN